MISTSEAGRVNALGRDIFYNTACDLYYERLHVAPKYGSQNSKRETLRGKSKKCIFFYFTT